MRKPFLFCVALACLFALCGCRGAEPACEFSAQAVRTEYVGKTVGDISFLNERPTADAIYAVSELSAYTDTYAACFDLSFAANSGRSFLGVTAAYEEQYFAKNNLVIVSLENSSGSMRNEVTKIVCGETLQIYIKNILPQPGTDDLADWFILIELDKAIDISAIDLIWINQSYWM